MRYNIEDIQRIGKSNVDKLTKAHISTTDDLLKLCKDAKGRQKIAETTGLSEARLLEWANMADLMRIQGIKPEFAELLEDAGVETLKELRTFNPTTLTEKLREVNERKHYASSIPATTIVQKWVEEAKKTEPTILK